MFEQLSLAAFLQRYWADNQVSCTVTFDPATEGSHIAHALDHFQYQLKGVSLLPRSPLGAYAQLPYEAISEEEYGAALGRLRLPIVMPAAGLHGENPPAPDNFCDTDTCGIDGVAPVQPPPLGAGSL